MLDMDKMNENIQTYFFFIESAFVFNIIALTYSMRNENICKTALKIEWENIIEIWLIYTRLRQRSLLFFSGRWPEFSPDSWATHYKPLKCSFDWWCILTGGSEIQGLVCSPGTDSPQQGWVLMCWMCQLREKTKPNISCWPQSKISMLYEDPL